MGIKQMYVKIDEMAHRISREMWQRNETKHHYETLKKTGIPIKKLSKAQKESIKNLWGVTDYTTHELIYSITGDFDVNYCPQSLFYTKLEFILNNQKLVEAWSDKNYFNKFFGEVKFPVSVVRNISGVFYDKDYNLITKSDAIEILKKYDKFCIKPSIDSGTGKGVRLVHMGENIGEIMDKYKSDYVIQEVLEQWQGTKQLNPSSVNIVRICTLFLNGRVSILSSSLRCGAQGKFADNNPTADGKGKFVVGVDSDGCLAEKGYYPCCESIKVAPSGITLKGIVLPNFEKAKELVISIHKKMPFARFVGFDVAFDSDGEPVIMEYNLKAPGMFKYQLTNGPIFAERTQEVIDTVLHK